MMDDASILALDVGQRRIGVAIVQLASRLPRPLITIEQSEKAFQTLAELIQEHNAVKVVVGLPRGLEGQETPQTSLTREFIELLEKHLTIPICTQDEALTSLKAEEELKTRGVRYNKESVDALAATYILEDFLRDNPGNI